MNWLKRRNGKFAGSLPMGNYKVTKYSIRKRAWGTTAILAVLVGVYMIGNLNSSVVYSQIEVPTDTLEKKVEQLKTELLDKLEKCESAGYSEADAPIIFDNNNRASIGTLQWQKRSVIHYKKILDNQDISQKDAVLIALDRNDARKLASRVIFETEKGLSNWQNCANKLGLQAELSFIKRLK